MVAYRPCHVTNSIFFRKFPIPTGSQGCSTGGPPMAINGILNNRLLTFPTGGQVWNIHGHRSSVGSVELTLPLVRCNGVSVQVRLFFVAH